MGLSCSDIAETAVSLQQAKTQASLQAIMLRKQHEMDQQMINLLTESAASQKSAPPEGMGQIVDRTA